MIGKVRRILSLALSLGLLFQQIGFSQVATELNIANHLARMASSFTVDKFRPVHLRYFSYDSLTDNFKVLLDKGDFEKGLIHKGTVPEQKLQEETKTLLSYFLIGVTLADSMFWVDLRPDSEGQIIDPYLERTDVGKIMLEADLQLKKDTALYTSPQTPEGREYWNRLYKKAAEIFGNENIEIPTLTRPWIVPGEIIVRESKDSAYVYKATLKVMLEQDYLKDSTAYNFKDERSKTLNEYSSQLIRELIIPKLTKEVNSSKRYAPLRQVYYSLILSRWFKLRFADPKGLSPSTGTVPVKANTYITRGTVPTFIDIINKQDLTNLTSQEPWSKTDYFKQYQKSFSDGEYNIKEPVYTPTGQVIRSYFSGGIQMASSAINPQNGISVSVDNAYRLGEVIGGRAVVDPQNISLHPAVAASPIEPDAELSSPKTLKLLAANIIFGLGSHTDRLTHDRALDLIRETYKNGAALSSKLRVVIASLAYAKHILRTGFYQKDDAYQFQLKVFQGRVRENPSFEAILAASDLAVGYKDPVAVEARSLMQEMYQNRDKTKPRPEDVVAAIVIAKNQPKDPVGKEAYEYVAMAFEARKDLHPLVGMLAAGLLVLSDNFQEKVRRYIFDGFNKEDAVSVESSNLPTPPPSPPADLTVYRQNRERRERLNLALGALKSPGDSRWRIKKPSRSPFGNKENQVSLIDDHGNEVVVVKYEVDVLERPEDVIRADLTKEVEHQLGLLSKTGVPAYQASKPKGSASSPVVLPFATINNIDVEGTMLLERPDLNVSIEGGHIKNLANPERRVVEAVKKTMAPLSEKGAKQVIIFHQGRLGDEKTYMDNPFDHAQQIRMILESMGISGDRVKAVNDLFGDEAVQAIKNLKNSEILVLKPVRAEDPENPGKTLEENPKFVSTLEPLFKYFVLDGFSVSHRKSTSVNGFSNLSAVAGGLMAYEYEGASNLKNLPRPHLVVAGGGKFIEKFEGMEAAFKNDKADGAIIGGRLANLALVAVQIAKLSGEERAVALNSQYIIAEETLGKATADNLKNDAEKPFALLPRFVVLLERYKGKIGIPKDMVYLDKDGVPHVVRLVDGRVPKEESGNLLVGIGPDTAEEYAGIAQDYQSALVNGPLSDSRYERLYPDMERVYGAIQKNIPFWTTGGGDTDSLMAKLGLTPSYASLAGGALQEFLSGRKLPGIEYLIQNTLTKNSADKSAALLIGDEIALETQLVQVLQKQGLSFELIRSLLGEESNTIKSQDIQGNFFIGKIQFDSLAIRLTSVSDLSVSSVPYFVISLRRLSSYLEIRIFLWGPNAIDIFTNGIDLQQLNANNDAAGKIMEVLREKIKAIPAASQIKTPGEESASSAVSAETFVKGIINRIMSGAIRVNKGLSLNQNDIKTINSFSPEQRKIAIMTIRNWLTDSVNEAKQQGAKRKAIRFLLRRLEHNSPLAKLTTSSDPLWATRKAVAKFREEKSVFEAGIGGSDPRVNRMEDHVSELMEGAERRLKRTRGANSGGSASPKTASSAVNWRKFLFGDLDSQLTKELEQVKNNVDTSGEPNFKVVLYGLFVEWEREFDRTYTVDFAKGVVLEKIKSLEGANQSTYEFHGNLAYPEDIKNELYIRITVASSPMNRTEATGGIDFRVLPMAIQPMGSFQGLNFSLPQLSRDALEQININQEIAQIKNMLRAGITPSGERIKELIAACVQKGQINSQIDNLLLCLADTFKLQEEDASESSPELREALVIVDSQS